MVDVSLIRGAFIYCPMNGKILNAKNRAPNSKKGSESGWVDVHGYRRVSINGIKHYAHHIAWMLYFGAVPKGVIDHINQNKLDNRISNLRDVAQSENCRNTPMRSYNKSGHQGVSWNDNSGKWIVQMKFNGASIYAGIYEDINDAINARDKMYNKYGIHKNHGAKK